MVGLARLVGLVLRRTGHRDQLPATEPRLDAIHPSGPRTDGGRGTGTTRAAAVGHSAASPGRGLPASAATHSGGGRSCPDRRRRGHALASLWIPRHTDLLRLLASHDGGGHRPVHRSLGSPLSSSCRGWGRGRCNAAVECHGDSGPRCGMPGAVGHQRRFIPPGHPLGCNCWSSRSSRQRLVVGAFPGLMGSPSALGNTAAPVLGGGRFIPISDSGRAGVRSNMGRPAAWPGTKAGWSFPSWVRRRLAG